MEVGHRGVAPRWLCTVAVLLVLVTGGCTSTGSSASTRPTGGTAAATSSAVDTVPATGPHIGPQTGSVMPAPAPTDAGAASDPTRNEHSIELTGAVFLDPTAAAAYTTMRTTHVDGMASSSGMQYLLASRPLVALSDDGASLDAAAVVQVFGPATSDRLAEWFGPFDATEQIAGRTVQRSWYGAIWLDGDIAFAVVLRHGDVDLGSLAANVTGWDGSTISLSDAPPRRWLDLPTTVGDLVDRGPAWTTVYAGPSGEPGLVLSHVTNPGEPAFAKLVNAGAELVTVRGRTAVAVEFQPGTAGAPAQLVWDEPDGSQVTLLLTPTSPGTASIEQLVELAGAVVDDAP